MPSSPQNKARLFDELVAEYCARSFGALSKKEVDLLMFRLMRESGRIKLDADMQEMSRQLMVPVSKVRSLLYDLQLRDKNANDENWFKTAILTVLKKARVKMDNGEPTVWVVIESPLLRKELEARAKRNASFVDSSFNRELLKLDLAIYARLLEEIAPNEYKAIQDAALKNLKKTNPKATTPILEEALRIFVTEFASSSGKEAGKKITGIAIDLSFGLLTGDMGIAGFVRKFFN